MGYREVKRKYYNSVKSILETDTSLWLKADNPLNTNTRWYDASPNNHVLNGTAILTDNVFNGQKGYVFNGSSNYFDGGDILDIGLNSRTMIVIGKINGAYGTFYAKSLAGGAGSRYALLREANAMFNVMNVSGVSFADSATTFRKIEQNVAIVDLFVTSHIFINDVLKNADNNSQTLGFQTTYNFLIGAYNSTSGGLPPYPGLYLNGTICEIIFFDRLLTTDEDTFVNLYLNIKYGL